MASRDRKRTGKKSTSAAEASAPGGILDATQLPHVLRGFAEGLAGALASALLAEWPKDEELAQAEQAGAIADVLIAPLHDELRAAKIAYLFKEKMGSGERIALGKAKRTSGPLAFLTDLDFVLVFNWTAWKALGPLQRIALVDHELCHCGRDDDGKYAIVHHDVEEFSGVVRRWGLWTSDLRMFGQAVKAQLDMFPDQGA